MQYPNVTKIRSMLDADNDQTRRALLAITGMRQQFLLYAASRDVFGLNESDDLTRPKEITIAEAQALIDKVQHSTYAAANWPRFENGQRVIVDNDMGLSPLRPDGSKMDGAFTDVNPLVEGTGPATMHLADNGFAMRRSVVLHELSHVVEEYERPFIYDWTGHGPQFARTNIEMLREFMSPEKASELETAFNFAGVKVASASHPHRSLQ